MRSREPKACRRYLDVSVIASVVGRLREEWYSLRRDERASMKLRKAGFPKREAPWLAGGFESTRDEIEETMDRRAWMIGGCVAAWTEEIFLSAQDSEREKTNERMRE